MRTPIANWDFLAGVDNTRRSNAPPVVKCRPTSGTFHPLALDCRRVVTCLYLSGPIRWPRTSAALHADRAACVRAVCVLAAGVRYLRLSRVTCAILQLQLAVGLVSSGRPARKKKNEKKLGVRVAACVKGTFERK